DDDRIRLQGYESQSKATYCDLSVQPEGDTRVNITLSCAQSRMYGSPHAQWWRWGYRSAPQGANCIHLKVTSCGPRTILSIDLLLVTNSSRAMWRLIR